MKISGAWPASTAPSAKLNGKPARVGSSVPEVPTYRILAIGASSVPLNGVLRQAYAKSPGAGTGATADAVFGEADACIIGFSCPGDARGFPWFWPSPRPRP